MNGEGTATIGPDLNVPQNPTEYFKEAALRQFIQNPESLRSWPSMKMRWVSSDSWQKEQLDQIIAYLKHMATHRK